MPKATTNTARSARRHNPLEEDVVATGILRQKAPKRKTSGEEDGDEEDYVDSRASKQILGLGRQLMEENEATSASSRPPAAPADAFAFDSRLEDAKQDDDDDDDAFADDGAFGNEDDEVVEEMEVSPDDLAAFRRFLPEEEDDLLKHGWPGQAPPKEEAAPVNLADLILAKIAEKESGQAPGLEVAPADEEVELPPKVVEVYSKVGMILSRWKAGKLPKPFKILPTLPQWETIIEITEPEKWTPNAVYAATKIFVSHKPIVVQRFMEMILLNRVREDIYENKRLNVHLMSALKKSLYKPASFFKGFLFPLVADNITLREAEIISKPLRENSIPVLHSAAALSQLCSIAAEEASQGTEGGGAINMLILTLLNKKYALPYQVLDSLVFHFLRFRSVDPASVKEGDSMEGISSMRVKLPVIWHQCLLSFAQRYRNDITEDQRELLLDLLLTHGHHKIGPEVRRELLAGRGRGVALEPQGSAFDGDDTMMDV